VVFSLLAHKCALHYSEVVGEHVGREFHNDFIKKFKTRLTPRDQLGREAPPNHMEDHHVLD
jgi:hypothetical protein